MRKRIAIALVPWLLCIPALAMSLSLGLGAGLELYDRSPGVPTPAGDIDQTPGPALVLIVLSVPAAWLALLVLTIAWVRRQRLARAWPIGGTALGLLALLSFGFALGPMGSVTAAIYASPGILFACFLCWFQRAAPAAGAPSTA